MELDFNLEDASYDVLFEHVLSHAERSIDGPELDVSIVDLNEPENTIESDMEDRTPSVDSDAVHPYGAVVDLHDGLCNGVTQK